MEQSRDRFYQEFIDFIKLFFVFIYRRIRFVVVLVRVFFEVLTGVASSAKKTSVGFMFWGRSRGYRWMIIASVAAAVLIIPVIAYKEPLTAEVYAEEDFYDTIAQNDLLIERGSVKTLVPQGRPRLSNTTYTVQRGDTLSKIAEMFDLQRVETLMWANGLSSPDLIKPGQVLVVPPGDGVIHKVKKGDTLESIAKKYNAAAQTIADINWIDDPKDLKVGMKIFVPEGTMPQPPKPTQPIAGAPIYGGGGGGAQVPVGGRWLSWPVAGGAGYVSQCPSAWHMAIDIADPSYPNLVAAADGTVIFAGNNDPYGYSWSVQIDHGNGMTTWYAHMSAIYVSSGQVVGRGQTIGKMGMSGMATGVHVHFELRNGTAWGGRINPAPYMISHVCGY